MLPRHSNPSQQRDKSTHIILATARPREHHDPRAHSGHNLRGARLVFPLRRPFRGTRNAVRPDGNAGRVVGSLDIMDRLRLGFGVYGRSGGGGTGLG